MRTLRKILNIIVEVIVETKKAKANRIIRGS